MYAPRSQAALFMVGATLAASWVAEAATQTATFDVKVQIQSMCTISAATLDFGALSGLDPLGSNVDAQSTITVTCTPGTPYNVGIDAGDVPLSTVLDRLMSTGSGDRISYQLYQDSLRNNFWGNTLPTSTKGGTGNGSAQTLQVFGRIATGQGRPVAGDYKSTVTATIYY